MGSSNFYNVDQIQQKLDQMRKIQPEELDSTTHLDTVIVSGHYVQSSNSEALPSNGYPINSAGFLSVESSPLYIITRQIYYPYYRGGDLSKIGEFWTRSLYKNVWSEWVTITSFPSGGTQGQVVTKNADGTLSWTTPSKGVTSITQGSDLTKATVNYSDSTTSQLTIPSGSRATYITRTVTGSTTIAAEHGATYDLSGSGLVDFTGDLGTQVAVVVPGDSISLAGEATPAGTYVLHLTSLGWQVYPVGGVVALEPDTTAPTAGTLAVTVTDVEADLTVTGATDDRGVTGYAFQVNGGAWSFWQTSPSYTATGLSPSTAYQFRHKVRDAAGNEAQGTVVSRSTTAEQVTLTTILTDPFTRADGPLNGYAAPTGQVWAGATGDAAITGNQLMPVTSAVYAPLGAQAREVTYDLTFPSSGGSLVWPWHDGTKATGQASVRALIGSNGQFALQNVTATYNASGGTNPHTPVGYMPLASGQTHTVKVTLIGGKVGLHVNGTLVLEGTPNAGATDGTHIGLAAVARRDHAVDNLEVKVAA